jgi:hypothetical protein
MRLPERDGIFILFYPFIYLWSVSGVHKLSKNQRGASNLQASENLRETGSVLSIHKYLTPPYEV